MASKKDQGKNAKSIEEKPADGPSSFVADPTEAQPSQQVSCEVSANWSYFVTDKNGKESVRSHHRVCQLAEVSTESGSNFDSWPSADEEEVVNRNGEIETFRLREIVKQDLSFLTGSGPVDTEDYYADDEKEKKKRRKKRTTQLVHDGYDGDVDEPKVEKKQPRKRRSRKLASDGNMADDEE